MIFTFTQVYDGYDRKESRVHCVIQHSNFLLVYQDKTESYYISRKFSNNFYVINKDNDSYLVTLGCGKCIIQNNEGIKILYGLERVEATDVAINAWCRVRSRR